MNLLQATQNARHRLSEAIPLVLTEIRSYRHEHYGNDRIAPDAYLADGKTGCLQTHQYGVESEVIALYVSEAGGMGEKLLHPSHIVLLQGVANLPTQLSVELYNLFQKILFHLMPVSLSFL